jgi:hypothetical protein
MSNLSKLFQKVVDAPVSDIEEYVSQVKPVVDASISTLQAMAGDYWKSVDELASVIHDEARSQAFLNQMRATGMDDDDDAGRFLNDQMNALQSYFSINEKFKSAANNLSKYRISVQLQSFTLLCVGHQAIRNEWIMRGVQLHIAKQGRLIGGECLRDWIWHGRNQAAHAEDLNKSTRAACEKLVQAAVIHTEQKSHPITKDIILWRFDLDRKESLADEFVRILNWTSTNAVVSDLKSLGR